MLSTRDLTALPDIANLRRIMQSLAILDAILCPEWEYRYFSFDSAWAPGEEMGSMRNGQGDHYFAWFGEVGSWIKGFSHESRMTPFSSDPPKVAAGVLTGVPSGFSACLEEPAFRMEETTFCFWRQATSPGWVHGPVIFPSGPSDPDGSAELLQYLDGSPSTYWKWAENYYEHDVPLRAIQAIYGHQPLCQPVVQELNDLCDWKELEIEIKQIGYPRAT